MKPNYSVLPADAVREVARDVERAVQRGDRDAPIADRGGVVVGDETVKQAIRMRATRSKLLNEFLSSGHAREDRNGLVSILRTKEYKKSTTARDRDRNALMIMSENADRWTTYEGIVKASKMPSKALTAVQEIFHEARVESMTPGQKFEDTSGATVVKER
jgi:hypothetical protein